jgi:hypothetical protein
MKLLSLILVFLSFCTVTFAQKTKTVTKPKTTTAPIVKASQQTKDSIVNILSSSTWEMNYMIVKGKKSGIPYGAKEKEIPRMVLTKAGIFKGLSGNKEEVVGTWKLSEDAKFIITTESKITNKLKIIKLTNEVLELKASDGDEIIGFVLEK